MTRLYAVVLVTLIWKVIPLESIAGRAEIERANVKNMKAMKN